jgi:toxin ParE1/3/4
MPTRVVWTPQARTDMLDLYLTIGAGRPRVAEWYFEKLEARARELGDFPRIGARRPDLRPSARMLSEPPYVILYETIPDTDDGPLTQVSIVRIVDARRDLPSLFFDAP